MSSEDENEFDLLLSLYPSGSRKTDGIFCGGDLLSLNRDVLVGGQPALDLLKTDSCTAILIFIALSDSPVLWLWQTANNNQER